MSKDKFNGKCEHDYKNQHRWEQKNLLYSNNILCLAYKCSQCQKVVLEEVEIIS